jgi:hypothetical protein
MCSNRQGTMVVVLRKALGGGHSKQNGRVRALAKGFRLHAVKHSY